MNFDNIFEYQIDIYDSVSYITVHELYDTPTKFEPVGNGSTTILTNNECYNRVTYYTRFPHYTFRYHTHTHSYKIDNKSINSLERLERYSFLNDYAKLLLKHRIQPDTLNADKTKRFKATKEPTSYEAAEQAKLDALERFRNDQISK
jgi:hypothetical protein